MKHLKHDGDGSYVPILFCNERFGRIMDKFEEIKKTYVETTNDLKNDIHNMKVEKQEKGHFFRNLLGVIVGGAMVAFIGFLINNLHF